MKKNIRKKHIPTIEYIDSVIRKRIESLVCDIAKLRKTDRVFVVWNGQIIAVPVRYLGNGKYEPL